MQVIEKAAEFSGRFSRWNAREDLSNYPWVENAHAPFTPLTRALPMLNLGLVTAAGAYIEGMEPFDLDAKDGDLQYREFPTAVDASDLRFSAKGYDPAAVTDDTNCLIPIDRLREFQENSVIGQLNNVWWSLSSHIPNARRIADELAPELAERLHRYQVQAALLIPTSRLSHQAMGLVARGIESTGIPTMVLSVDPRVTERVRPPRVAFYKGEHSTVSGLPNFPEHQRRILDESIRWIETFDQPGSRKLVVELESVVEAGRGER
jgi:D-proline reductase (dithiol) PrdB